MDLSCGECQYRQLEEYGNTTYEVLVGVALFHIVKVSKAAFRLAVPTPRVIIIARV